MIGPPEYFDAVTSLPDTDFECFAAVYRRAHSTGEFIGFDR